MCGAQFTLQSAAISGFDSRRRTVSCIIKYQRSNLQSTVQSYRLERPSKETLTLEIGSEAGERHNKRERLVLQRLGPIAAIPLGSALALCVDNQ